MNDISIYGERYSLDTRLDNYERALLQLEKAVNISRERDLVPLEEQGMIQSFEFTHELAWKVMKDYF